MQKIKLQHLEQIFHKDNLSIDEDTRRSYSYDASHAECLPDVVVFAELKEQISSLLKYAHENKIPVTPRGAGSGLSGGSVPISQGIVLVLDRMNKVIKFEKENRLITVQPGVITSHIDEMVNPHGLFYPPDPGSVSFSTVGGNVAENAGGLRGLKYGVTKDYVKALEVILPNGNIIHPGSETIKHVTGLNIESLFVGSEGVLGVISEITLKLLPRPTHQETLLVSFASLIDAAQTVKDIMSLGVTPCTLEIMDQFTINCVEDFEPSGLPRTAAALLIIETDGFRESAQFEMHQIETVISVNKYQTKVKANNEGERKKILQGRRYALPSLTRKKPSIILEDVTVKPSLLPQLIEGVQQIAQKYNLMMGAFGHAGDGNLHPCFLIDKKNLDEVKNSQLAVNELFDLTIQLGGTLSGEHGIGLEKKPYLHKQLSQNEIQFLKQIKSTIDPNNILNPGKIWD